MLGRSGTPLQSLRNSLDPALAAALRPPPKHKLGLGGALDSPVGSFSALRATPSAASALLLSTPKPSAPRDVSPHDDPLGLMRRNTEAEGARIAARVAAERVESHNFEADSIVPKLARPTSARFVRAKSKRSMQVSAVVPTMLPPAATSMLSTATSTLPGDERPTHSSKGIMRAGPSNRLIASVGSEAVVRSTIGSAFAAVDASTLRGSGHGEDDVDVQRAPISPMLAAKKESNRTEEYAEDEPRAVIGLISGARSPGGATAWDASDVTDQGEVIPPLPEDIEAPNSNTQPEPFTQR